MKNLTEPEACQWLHDRAAEVPNDQAVVEIGVFQGGSLQHLCQGALAGAHPPVFGVDPWGLPGVYPEGGRRFELYGRPNYRAEAEQAAPTAFLIRDFSVPVARQWDSPPIGLLYIDGDHHKTLEDFNVWERHLAPFAWVAFDDYNDRHRDVVSAVEAIFFEGRLKSKRVIGSRLAIGRRPS